MSSIPTERIGEILGQSRGNGPASAGPSRGPHTPTAAVSMGVGGASSALGLGAAGSGGSDAHPTRAEGRPSPILGGGGAAAGRAGGGGGPRASRVSRGGGSQKGDKPSAVATAGRARRRRRLGEGSPDADVRRERGGVWASGSVSREDVVAPRLNEKPPAESWSLEEEEDDDDDADLSGIAASSPSLPSSLQAGTACRPVAVSSANNEDEASSSDDAPSSAASVPIWTPKAGGGSHPSPARGAGATQAWGS